MKISTFQGKVMKSLPSQVGATLLIFMTILLLGFTSLLLVKVNNTVFLVENQKKTAAALAEAKEALLGYAVSYTDSYPGDYSFLPCPDTSNSSSYPEGAEHGNCTGKDKNSLGRLPWRTLGLHPLRDGAGECLWYAVSGRYKNASTAKTDMLNEDSNGAFKIYVSNGTTVPSQSVGQAANERAVALIIAPGRPIGDQDRTPLSSGVEECGGNYNAANYLDNYLNLIDNTTVSTSANVTDDFVAGQGSLQGDYTINDHVIYITREELYRAFQQRQDFIDNTVLLQLAQVATYCLASYPASNLDFTSGDKRLPWPAHLGLTDYQQDTYYDDQDTYLTGRLPDTVDDSNGEIGKSLLEPKLITECRFADFMKTVTNSEQVNICTPPISVENQTLCTNVSGYLANCTTSPIDLSYVTFCEQMESHYKAKFDFLVNTTTRWKNWKDHLFYAVANAYKPNATLIAQHNQICDNSDAATGNDCLELNGNLYAAIVFFSGERLLGQRRDAAPDTDTKAVISNYLEGEHSSSHPSTSGNENYDLTSGVVSNDVLFCIDQNFVVTKCT